MQLVVAGLFLLLLISIITSHTVIAVVAAAAIFFKDKWTPHLQAATGTATSDEVKYDLCDLCGPADPFNTYDKTTFAQDVDREYAEYRAMTEYPREIADEIPQAFSNRPLQSADDYCARAQRYTQRKIDDAIVNRARLNANTFRPYFADELDSGENATWWNVDQMTYNTPQNFSGHEMSR